MQFAVGDRVRMMIENQRQGDLGEIAEVLPNGCSYMVRFRDGVEGPYTEYAMDLVMYA